MVTWVGQSVSGCVWKHPHLTSAVESRERENTWWRGQEKQAEKIAPGKRKCCNIKKINCNWRLNKCLISTNTTSEVNLVVGVDICSVAVYAEGSAELQKVFRVWLWYSVPVQNCYDVSISLKVHGAWNEKALVFLPCFRGKLWCSVVVMTENLVLIYPGIRSEWLF